MTFKINISFSSAGKSEEKNNNFSEFKVSISTYMCVCVKGRSVCLSICMCDRKTSDSDMRKV